MPLGWERMSRARRWQDSHYGGGWNEVADTWRETTSHTMSGLTDGRKHTFRAREVHRDGAGESPARASVTLEDSNVALDGCGPICTVSDGDGNPFTSMAMMDSVRVLGIGGRGGAYLDRIEFAHCDRGAGTDGWEYGHKTAGDPRKTTGRNRA